MTPHPALLPPHVPPVPPSGSTSPRSRAHETKGVTTLSPKAARWHLGGAPKVVPHPWGSPPPAVPLKHRPRHPHAVSPRPLIWVMGNGGSSCHPPPCVPPPLVPSLGGCRGSCCPAWRGGGPQDGVPGRDPPSPALSQQVGGPAAVSPPVGHLGGRREGPEPAGPLAGVGVWGWRGSLRVVPCPQGLPCVPKGCPVFPKGCPMSPRAPCLWINLQHKQSKGSVAPLSSSHLAGGHPCAHVPRMG